MADVGPGVAVPAAGDLLHEQARVVEDAGNSTAVKQLSRAANSRLLFIKNMTPFNFLTFSALFLAKI